MKVLLISPYGKHLKGGIASWTEHIMSYYKLNATEDCDLELLYNPNSKASYASTSFIRRIINGLQSYLPLISSFNKTTKRKHYDLVHICTSASISLIKDLAIVKRAKKRGIKTVVHCRFGRIPEILETKNWEHVLFEKLLKITDQLLVIDMKSFNCLIQAGYSNIQYLPNPLSVSIQQLVNKHASMPRVPNRIVFVGHVVKTKGVVELVKACSQINGIELRLIGPIPDENLKAYINEIEKNSNNHFLHVTGALPIEQVIEEMLSCAIFALPTYTEGFPNVIIESMACGCPIVTTPVGAIPEMLDINGEKPCGICVAPKNVEQLREALQYLLDNHEEALRMGIIAKERVNKEYSMQIVWNKLLDVWKH